LVCGDDKNLQQAVAGGTECLVTQTPRLTIPFQPPVRVIRLMIPAPCASRLPSPVLTLPGQYPDDYTDDLNKGLWGLRTCDRLDTKTMRLAFHDQKATDW